MCTTDIILLGGGPLVIVQQPIDKGKPFAPGQVRMHAQLLGETQMGSGGLPIL